MLDIKLVFKIRELCALIDMFAVFVPQTENNLNVSFYEYTHISFTL